MSNQQDESTQDITLHDLMRELQRNRQEIMTNRQKIDTFEQAMNAGFAKARYDRKGIKEDLEATMMDAYKLKQYAGMLQEE